MNTKRLILRDLKKTDCKELAEHGNDKDINFFNWYIPFPFKESDAKRIISERIENFDKKRTIHSFAIVLKQTKRFIGIIEIYGFNKEDCKAKIGFWLGKKYRGKGYVPEALEKIIKFSFENLKLNKLSAYVIKSNKISINILKKFNFRKVGVQKRDKLFEGKYYDVILFELLKGGENEKGFYYRRKRSN